METVEGIRKSMLVDGGIVCASGERTLAGGAYDPARAIARYQKWRTVQRDCTPVDCTSAPIQPIIPASALFLPDLQELPLSPFVRFVFGLLIAGSVIAFSIVLLADMRSEQTQSADMTKERERFADIIARYNGHLRHGDIAVEWQKTDATQQVMETSLLVRIYALDADGNETPLPILRVVIPHNRVSVDGLQLDFDSGFPEQYKALRGVRLAYFDHIYTDEQPLDERFSLLSDSKVPRDTAIHADRVTHYELELWENLWEMIDTPKLAAKTGLKAVRTPPATRSLEDGKVYSIYLGVEGVQIVENTDPAVLNNMLSEAHRVDAETLEQNVAQ
jgi:hypothetical protein